MKYGCAINSECSEFRALFIRKTFDGKTSKRHYAIAFGHAGVAQPGERPLCKTAAPEAADENQPFSCILSVYTSFLCEVWQIARLVSAVSAVRLRLWQQF